MSTQKERPEQQSLVLEEARRQMRDVLCLLNADTQIATKLDMPAGEVRVLLRILHRSGVIGLVVQPGTGYVIAPQQAELEVRFSITERGISGAVGPRRRSWRSTRSETPEQSCDDHDRIIASITVEHDALLAEFDSLVDLLTRAENLREKAERDKTAAETDKSAAENRLQEARRVAREQSVELVRLREETSEVAALRQQLTEANANAHLPDDMATRLRRILASADTEGK